MGRKTQPSSIGAPFPWRGGGSVVRTPREGRKVRTPFEYPILLTLKRLFNYSAEA